MHKHVTAHFPDRASAQAAHDALQQANVYAHDIHIEEENGGVAVRAYVQPEEVERAVAILKGERAPNDTRSSGAAEAPRAGKGTSDMAGGPDGSWSREDQVRPDGSASAPGDYSGPERRD